MEETAEFTIAALTESNNILQQMLSQYRESNRRLRRVNSALRTMIAMKHAQDEAFKQQTVPLVETYWGDPAGHIHRMSGEQEVIAVATDACTAAEYVALSNITTNV
jgi:hypothetical protein